MLHVIFHLSLGSAALLDHCNQFFVDSQGLSCEDYEDDDYCTENGGYGSDWNISTTFEEYAVNSETALNCPECGCTDEYTNASDPYAVLYEDDRVHEIYITMDPDDWTELRLTNADDAYDNLYDENGECLTQPLSNDFDWYRANITWNNETLLDCGVRKKGFIGSVIGDGLIKPSLKIDTDEFVDDQEFGGWLERFTLNNNAQTYTISTCLSYKLFRGMGVTASRCNFAKVYVNNEYKGLYSNVEPIKKAFLRQNFDDYDDGNLYEGAVSDFESSLSSVIEKKNNKGDDDWSDVEQVIDALDANSYADLAEIVDLQKFLTFWSAEVILGHVDGYANNQNNWYAYVNEDGKFEFIPWGTDHTFFSVKSWDRTRMSLFRSVMVEGRLCHFLYQEYLDLFVSEMETLLNSTNWNTTEIISWATEFAEIAAEHGPGYDYGTDTATFTVTDYDEELETISAWISSRRDNLLDELVPTPVEWDLNWTSVWYDELCLEIYDNGGGSDCITVNTSIYLTEGTCDEESNVYYASSVVEEWAATCDEVSQVYADALGGAGQDDAIWGICFDYGTIYYKSNCTSGCAESSEDEVDGTTAGGGDDNTVVIVSCVVGICLVICIMALAYWCWKHRLATKI